MELYLLLTKKMWGLISGIVGAGGNLGGMALGFLFKSESISYVQAFQYIGYTIIAVSLIIFITRFTSKEEEDPAQLDYDLAE